MDMIKSVIASPWASTFLQWKFWPYYLAGLALLLVLAILAFVLLRKGILKAPGGSALGKRLASSPKDPQDTLPRSSLLKIWKAFLNQIPVEFRRLIQSYRLFVVLGESGSGKSTLIDNGTDWRGQARRFYPSYTVAPLLQIYLGSKALVMEVPSSLTGSTSKSVREALVQLWRPILRKREATAVIVLNAMDLIQEIPENLRRSAQSIRGKLNILAEVQRRPVQVHVVLTHMDQLEGYTELSHFFIGRNLPLQLVLAADSDLSQIERCLDPAEGTLPLALTTGSSGDFLKIVSFFKDAPQVLSSLRSFVRDLEAVDPLAPAPRMDRICLGSREGRDPEGCNPFAFEGSTGPIRREPPHIKHRVAAAVVFLGGLVYMGLNYYGERSVLVEADKTMNIIQASPLRQYNEYSHRLFMELLGDIQSNIWDKLPPTFFPQAQGLISGRMVSSIRTLYLIPAFMGLKQGEDSQEKGIYLLGLIYANKGNDLGKLVLSHLDDWQKALNLPRLLISDYVLNNGQVADIILDVSPSQLQMLKSVTSAREDPVPWHLFFNKVKRACNEPYVSKEYFHGLQKEAGTFLSTVERIARYRLTNQLLAMLRIHSPIGPQITWIQKRNEQLEQESLRDFLSKLADKTIEYPSVIGTGLSQFIESAKIIAGLKNDDDGTEYRFVYDNVAYSFSAGGWNHLAMRSRLTLFMREFLANNRRMDGLIFFSGSSGTGYPDILMNPSNDGQLFFVGKGKIDGAFTKTAFEQQVKPVLTELPDLLRTLPIAEDEKKRFFQFVLKQAEAYADRYVSAYRGYYSQFHMAADSISGLRYLLKQIQLPTSPFQDFLGTIKENTVLDVGDSPYLRQFGKKLGVFEFIRRLMAEKDGAFPEYDKYKALLKQMDDELDNTQSFAAINKADDSNELKAILSPVGRISLGIFRGENDSYMNLVRTWIKSIGMDAEWQAPFTEPVSVAFFLGRSDIETSVEKVWEGLLDSYVRPLQSKFPFNPKTEVEITPQDLEKVAHPQGSFWKTFRSYLAPICQESSGVWTERVSSLGIYRIPDKMLKTVNSLSTMASNLWNDKGIPQPILIQIKPAGLPPRAEYGPIPILAYLRADKSSVFAFNQQPAWQKIEIEWWKAQTSAVGLEFEALLDAGKSYREITIPEGFWTFHHLLQRAEMIDKYIYVWKVAGPAPQHQMVRTEFSMKTDPWAVFRLVQ